MCSIMFAYKSIDIDLFKKEFYKTKYRGPDDTKIIEIDDVILGFHRLAIMDLDSRGMQPFVYKNRYLICNGEVYGFEKIKKELENEYAFYSDSDCEVLLPLYEKYGLNMFKMLDSEFALVIYDSSLKKVIAARDPIGIRPLYYGYDSCNNIAFSSEPKNLINIVDKVYPFPPGHYYIDGKFVSYLDITNVDNVIDEDIDTICKNIKDKLILGIKKRLVADANVGFLLSGGLDSSLVCAIAQKCSDRPIETFAIGMAKDAIDLKYAKEVSEYIGSNHHEIIITSKDVLASLEEVINILGTYDITTIRASIGMYLVCKYIHQNTNIRVLLTGEISDELFGYKYTDFAPNAQEFQNEAIKRIKELHMYDVLRADRCISANSLEARVPFGDIEFVRYVMSINPELKLNKYNKGKYLLRHAFENDQYLPENILWREKAAFSDAVGHSMVNYLKDYAEKYYSDEQFKSKINNYDNPRPFTKESLLYREIFEKYYPNNSEMISGYWMPNKNWEGCDVDDPSARVLSNYGDSGK